MVKKCCPGRAAASTCADVEPPRRRDRLGVARDPISDPVTGQITTPLVGSSVVGRRSLPVGAAVANSSCSHAALRRGGRGHRSCEWLRTHQECRLFFSKGALGVRLHPPLSSNDKPEAGNCVGGEPESAPRDRETSVVRPREGPSAGNRTPRTLRRRPKAALIAALSRGAPLDAFFCLALLH